MKVISRIRFGLLAATIGVTSGCQLVSGLSSLEVKDTKADEGDDTTDEDDTTTDDDTTTSRSDAGGTPDCTIPSGSACAPVDNCGCSNGQVCGLGGGEDNFTVACQAPGEKELGDTCELGECGEGLLCIEQLCVQVCRFDNDCESDAAKCTQVLRPNGEELKGVRYCRANCDLVDPTDPADGLEACTAGQTCLTTDRGSACSSSAGDAGQGETCQESADCAAGFACHDAQCKQWCSLTSPQCGTGLECEASGDSSPSATGLGLCGGGCDATIPEGDECLTDPECGCASGQTCRVMEDSSRACSPIGNTAAQTPCANNGDCAAGLACMEGLCRPYCDPADATCGDDSLCAEMLYEGQSVGIGACLGLCDPIHPEDSGNGFTACGVGAECVAGNVGYDYPIAHCMVAPEEPGPLVGACDANNPCGAGAACVFGRCFPYCRETEDCNGATESPYCFDSGFDYRGAENDELGLCCSPTEVPGSLCAFDIDCGCNDGFSCRVGNTTTGATECTPIGEAGYQQECADDGDCITGHSCVGGLCSPHCAGADTCAYNEGECIQIYSGGDDPAPVPYAYVCAGRCDPVDVGRTDYYVKPCGVGADCVPGYADVTDDFSYASFCAPNPEGGDGTLGAACGNDGDCALGFGCDFRQCDLNDAQCLGTCAHYCYETNDCEPGLTCDLSIGRVGEPGVAVGICALAIGPLPDAG